MRNLLESLSETLASEGELLKLERKIDDDVRGALFQNQREFYLQEQLRAIHKELGEEDGDDLLRPRGSGRQEIAARDREDSRASRAAEAPRMSPMSPEFTVSRNFIDWIIGIPWDERSEDVLDVAHARAILDEDHYGLEEVKERILDFIAVLSLVGHIEGQILCFVGPPGVGKTSLGRSIARALGRRFIRMALGGVRDEAEIRGHRRTYIGSMPGRIIQAMRRAEVVNPVILLDEVDKLGQDYRGDPAAALLEVLDPSRTRPSTTTISRWTTTCHRSCSSPPRTRWREFRSRCVTGWRSSGCPAISTTKSWRSRGSFWCRVRSRQTDSTPSRCRTWDAEVLPAIMRGYTREAGVRELERRLARVRVSLRGRQAEKPADSKTQTVTVDDLRELLGSPPYDPDDASLEDKVGVASGLAYTCAGGEVLEVEVSVVKGRGKVQLTGTLGDVMKESASAALSYARTRAHALGLDGDFYRNRDIHIHMPAGATPKDGPSAGIAIATGVISALTGVPVRGDVAMTGEITLRGRVLPIGGLKEKSVAAHRNKISDVIIPYGNSRDVDDLPEEVRASVRFHPVKTMDEVLTIALRGDVLKIGASRAAKRAAAAAATEKAATDALRPGLTAH